MTTIPIENVRLLQLRTCPGCGERLVPFGWLPLAIVSKRSGVVTIEAVTYPVCQKCDARVFDEEQTWTVQRANRDLFPGADHPTFQGRCDAVVREWVEMDAELSAFRGGPHADVL